MVFFRNIFKYWRGGGGGSSGTPKFMWNFGGHFIGIGNTSFLAKSNISIPKGTGGVVGPTSSGIIPKKYHFFIVLPWVIDARQSSITHLHDACPDEFFLLTTAKLPKRRGVTIKLGNQHSLCTQVQCGTALTQNIPLVAACFGRDAA